MVSAAEGVSVGERFYGFFPMSSHLVVSPKRVDAGGFFDGAPHRRLTNLLDNGNPAIDGAPMLMASSRATGGAS